jgi:hypothetical protein
VKRAGVVLTSEHVVESMTSTLELVPRFDGGEMFLLEMTRLMSKIDTYFRLESECCASLVELIPMLSLTTLKRKLTLFELWRNNSFTGETCFDLCKEICASKNKLLVDNMGWAFKFRKFFDKIVHGKHGKMPEVHRLADGNFSTYSECPVCLNEIEDNDRVIRACCGFNSCRECSSFLASKTCSQCRCDPLRTLKEIKDKLIELSNRGSE